jgi:hypothetical protein
MDALREITIYFIFSEKVNVFHVPLKITFVLALFSSLLYS